MARRRPPAQAPRAPAGPGRVAAALAGAAAFAGCGPPGMQSSLDPAGPQASKIEGLFWLFFDVSVVVFGLVMAALVYAILRRRPPGGDAGPARVEPAVERRLARAVGVATAATAVTLVALLVASVVTGRALAALEAKDALAVSVVGHQWWWEVQYHDPQPHNLVVTANEIHVPVGRPIMLQLTSRDVIHSFWVPNLHGKRDLIPGHEGHFTLRADRPGVYRGQCAEYCGYQHANMSFFVVAEEPAAFEAWLQKQREPAAEPAGEPERRGREVFLGGPCAMCHAVRGTVAGSNVGPDLTHVASRLSLAAGTLPNSTGHLAGWLVDPQHLKPGNAMPPTPMPPDDLQALLAYLGGLK
jgi:cytochrome c oxidase subunit 2